MFSSIAYAMGTSGGGAPPQGGAEAFMQSMFPLILIFGIFYFLLIRPQQKRAKEHEAMLKALKKGDRIVTSGGLYGVITSLKGQDLEVKIADNVRVLITRSSVAQLADRSEEEKSHSKDKVAA